MAGLAVAEVPSYEHPRLHGVSNLSAFRDGRRVLRTILAERHRTPYRAAHEASEPSRNLRQIAAVQTVFESTSISAMVPLEQRQAEAVDD
jgi:hypothetical protein